MLNKINNKYIIHKINNNPKINTFKRKSEIKIDGTQSIKSINNKILLVIKIYQIVIISINNINKMIQILSQIQVLKITQISRIYITIKIYLI